MHITVTAREIICPSSPQFPPILLSCSCFFNFANPTFSVEPGTGYFPWPRTQASLCPAPTSLSQVFFQKYYFPICGCSLRHFYNPTWMIACLKQLLNSIQLEKVSCYQKTSQYSESRAGGLATTSWGCRCICCTAKICRSTLRVSAAGIWIYKRKCKNLI